MKKYFLLALLFPLWGIGGVSAQASKVKIESVGANYAAATPTVTFSVSWQAGSRNANEQSKLWVWIDYRPMKNNAAAGSWQRAGITETPTYHSAGTPALESGNDSGFWLQGSTDNSAFSSTLTVRVNVDLSGFDPQFNWCAYASDRPPHAEPIEGGYTLNGTAPFIIQTQRNNSGSTASISSSTYHNCIYGLTDATGAPGVVQPVPEITGFTSSATTLCAGQSATLTATLAKTGSFSYSFNNGATWQTNATKVVTPTTSTTYILKAKHADGGCTVTAPSPIEITVHPTPDVAFVNPPTGLCANTSATLTVNDANNAGSSYCFTYDCNGCIHNPYTCGNDSTAAAGCDWFSECIYDVANTYSVNMYDAGSMTVWVKAKTEYGCADSVSTVISLMPPPTITLISASDWVAVGHNVAMTEIKYATTNAAGATVTGLPPGVSGSWSMNTYTIGGTPTQIGTFPYTVTTTNAHGCIDASATGIIQVATGCVRSTYTLGTVGFANADTYTQNGITISAPVTATGCQKTSFDAGASGSFTADCREVPGYNAAYYSWCMAMHWNTVLCPSPWRVPSRNDIRTYIDNSAIGSDYLMPSVMGTHDWQPVGYISRASSPNPIAIGTAAWFWLSNSTGPDEAGALIVTSDTHTSPVSKTSGAALRCVQDAP